MEWTRDKTLNLINEYRKRRGLWDMTHDDYRKKEMKQKLLVEVATSLGDSIPVVEIEKKFHTLRTQYHREINRMKRKEPYNSKWFGFKTLQFLSSPKACRMGKGRVKSEITEEGTVTKYIIQDMTSCHETSAGSVGCSSNNNEEFAAIQRKPNRPATTAITYENANDPITVGNSRSRELEKLIEETTKDVDEVEETKPKMSTIKQITLPLEQRSYSATVSSTGEMSVTEQQQSSILQQQHHHQESHHHQQQQQQIDEEHVETIDIQTASEISYQTSTSPVANGSGHHAVHHQTIPTRIIKIQRRDTCQEDEYYNDEDEQQQHEHPGHHGLHTLSTNTSGKHRIFYETNGQQHTATILATPTVTPVTPAASSTLLNSGAIKFQRNGSGGSQHLQLQQQQQQCRDEFSTYGEYVANEMREIASREILIALKHKINTALFEASMAELQK